MVELFGGAWPDFPAGDLAAIAAPVDFVGLNYYKRGVMRNDPAVVVERARRVDVPGSIYTETGWEVHAPALVDLLLWFRDRYGPTPVYLTENGAAFYDPPQAIDGEVDDPLRVHYLREHLRAAGEALAPGVDLRGYFVWSLLDNLEWSHGFEKRFGIVHVDFATQKRTPKRSAWFYRDVIRSGGAALAEG